MRKNIVYIIFIILCGQACNRQEPPENQPDVHMHQTTIWSDRTELFMEYTALLAGEPSEFTVHLTDLSDFKPVNVDEVNIVFTSEGNRIEKQIDGSSRAGIYQATIQFDSPGTWQMVLSYGNEAGDTLLVDQLEVTTGSDHEAEQEEAGQHVQPEIFFLKEQQWNIDFRSEVVESRELSASIEATGEIISKINSDVVVSSPFTALVLPDHNPDLPQIGATVSVDSRLVVLTPSVDAGEDSFAARYIQRKNDLDLARVELERAERLYARQAVPEKDLQEARAAFESAEAAFGTISSFVETFDFSAQFGVEHLDLDFLIRSPLSGTIEEIYFQLGRQIDAGEPMFRIINSSDVWLKINVPATRISEVDRPAYLSVSIHGQDESLSITPQNGRLVSEGNIVDPSNRTVPLVFEIDNSDRRLKIGMYADVRIYTGERRQVLAVPEDALVEDEGVYSVFIQQSGESFIKKEALLGIREFGYVEIVEGLLEGDRVITSGTYHVKLASISSQLPEHGHVH